MKRQVHLILSALSFYTRCPVPQRIHDNNATLLPDAIRYLPVVGWISGIISGFVYLSTAWFFGSAIGIIMALIAGILFTGAFHEDGFADVCDGFGGGYTKDSILEIMKDSHLGTYGVIGLILLLGVKFLALYQALEGIIKQSILHWDSVFTILLVCIVAHSLSRFAAITVVFTHNYARISKSKVSNAVEKRKVKNLLLAALFTLLPLTVLVLQTGIGLFAVIIIPVLGVAFVGGSYFKKHIGGYTGDCLGAVQQIAEVVIYLSFTMIWRFI